jgi:isoleucyl-tRNA synthetase
VVARQYGISAYCPVDGAGRFYHAEGAAGTLPEQLIGKSVWEANPLVIEILQQADALLAHQTIEHSYPHCWRCHNPTIFRATEQWFIGMDRNKLREHACEQIRRVRWMPSWGEERMYNMVSERPDWCISRQRIWGVPITVLYCENCLEPLTDRKVLDHVVDLFRTHSADIWYERPGSQLVPEGTRCPKCGGGEFSKEMDILDVWFDSGSSHLAVLGHSDELPWPSDLYLEGGDQHRGWFQSSLLVGTGLKNESPYRGCLTHGYVLDGEGRAMSKSLGNVIEPEKIIKQAGAEILRLWVASVEYNEDVRASETILQRLTEAYRKLRNTFRYALGNLAGFDPSSDAVPGAELQEIDQWILVRADDLVARCRRWYDDFAFHKIYRAVYDFATVDLSAVYFDISKDRLYTAGPKSLARRSAQTALHRINYALVRLMAPILSFTAEEVWEHMAKPEGLPESVHLALFPEPGELIEGIAEQQRVRAENFDRLLSVREAVLKELEIKRQEKFIGAPLEAKVLLKAGGEIYPLLDEYQTELAGLFIVSQVELANTLDGSDVRIEVQRASGAKCERCWKYTTDVGANPQFPGVCQSCADTLTEMLS